MSDPALAYQYPERVPERAPERSPRIRVVPGQRPNREVEELPSVVLLVAKIVAVFFVVFALLGFVRIGLASATVTTAVATEDVLEQIDYARSAGNELEVRESHLSNPTYLKAEAAKLSMTAPSETTVISLEPDVVVTDDSGNLSLVGSLKLASQG